MEIFSALLDIFRGIHRHRWIPSQRPVTRSLDVVFDLRLKKSWANNREAGDLKRHRAQYDVTIMIRYVKEFYWTFFYLVGV